MQDRNIINAEYAPTSYRTQNCSFQPRLEEPHLVVITDNTVAVGSKRPNFSTNAEVAVVFCPGSAD